MDIKNKDGRPKRKPSDNIIIQNAGSVVIDREIIDYDQKTNKWILNGKFAGHKFSGSLSS